MSGEKRLNGALKAKNRRERPPGRAAGAWHTGFIGYRIRLSGDLGEPPPRAEFDAGLAPRESTPRESPRQIGVGASSSIGAVAGRACGDAMGLTGGPGGRLGWHAYGT